MSAAGNFTNQNFSMREGDGFDANGKFLKGLDNFLSWAVDDGCDVIAIYVARLKGKIDRDLGATIGCIREERIIVELGVMELAEQTKNMCD